MKKNQEILTMNSQVIQINYVQGDPVKIVVPSENFCRDKDFERALTLFMQGVNKYYCSGNLMPVHYYFPNLTEMYINLSGLRSVTYKPLLSELVSQQEQKDSENNLITNSDSKPKSNRRKEKKNETTSKN